MSEMRTCKCGQRLRADSTVVTCPQCGASGAGSLTEVEAVSDPIIDLPTLGPGHPLQDAPLTETDEATLDRPRPQQATASPIADPTEEAPTAVGTGGSEQKPLCSPGEQSPTLSQAATGRRIRETLKKVTPPVSGKPQARRAVSRMEDYELLGVLGRGGMGIVHKARHVKLDRLVALKTILAGSLAGPAQLARFQIEAEAVARLQHPNIVQIYDIGEHNGQPFVALEFVDGGSLQQKLDGTPVAACAAAELVVSLARAVDYAHQRGIVHRDLKPANILLQSKSEKDRSLSPCLPVSLSGFVPKITDFGLAKRTDDQSGQTGTGDVLGTPSYMSPEQATGKNEHVGPAADTYALGAILYDSLTGRPPFKGETVLDTLAQVQGREPLPPTRLQPKVPRDIETICLKCLQKEPSKRYASAGALAEDLQRFIDNRPILARPTPWWERLQKWARRRPAVAALLATLAFVLTAAFLGMFGLWQEAEAERGAAVTARDESVRQEQKAVAARIEAENQRDRADKNLQQAFAAGENLLSRVAEERLLKVPQMEGLRMELLLKAKTFFERFYEIEGGTPAVRYQASIAHRRVGSIFEQLRKYDEAKSAYDKSIALLSELTQESPGKRDYRSTLAGTRNNLGVVLQALEQTKAAESQYTEALRLLEALRQDFPMEVSFQRELATAFNNLASLLLGDPKRHGETEQAYRKALDILGKLHLDYPKDREYQAELARALNSFGLWHLAGGQRDEAATHFGQALALWTDLASQERDQPVFADGRAVALLNLAVVWKDSKPAKAEEAYREAAALQERLVQDFPQIADYRHNLALCWTNLSVLLAADPKRRDEAAELRRKAMTHWEKLIERDGQSADYQVRLIGCFFDDALYHQGRGELDKALDRCKSAVKLQEQLSAAHPQRTDFQLALARGYVDLGRIYGDNKQSEGEESSYRQALKKIEEILAQTKSPPPGWLQLMADVHCNLGAMRGERLEMAEALPWLQKAVDFQTRAWRLDEADAQARRKLASYSLMLITVQVELKDHAAASATAADLQPILLQFSGTRGNELHMLARALARCLPLVAGEPKKKLEDQVVGILQAAVQQGLSDPTALRAPMFAPLKGRADFDQLLRELDKK